MDAALAAQLAAARQGVEAADGSASKRSDAGWRRDSLIRLALLRGESISEVADASGATPLVVEGLARGGPVVADLNFETAPQPEASRAP